MGPKYPSNKRDFIKEKQLARWIMKYTKCLSTPLPFYATQIITTLINSIISANHDKVEKFDPQWWNPYKGDCFSFVKSLLEKQS